MSMREILTKWGFEIEHEKLDKVEHQLEAIKHRVEFLAAAEVVKGLFELGEKFGEFAEQLHATASSAGITVEAFQKLAFSASQSAVTQDEMSTSMARLSRSLYEARRGGAEAQKAFSQAGFSPEQIQGFHSSSDAMLALADRFKGIQDPIKKQALAMELLGRGSIHMVGFLSKGSAAIKAQGVEAEKLGIVLSEHQVEALVKVEHAMSKLLGVVKGIAATFASLLAPALEAAVNDLLKFYLANKAIVEVNLKEWVWDVTYAMGFVWGIVKFLIKGFIDLAKALHIEKDLGVITFAFIAWIGTLFAAEKAMALVKAASNLMTWSFSPLVGALKLVRGLVASLATRFLPLLVEGETAAAIGAGIMEAPLWLIATVVGAVVLAVQALWTVLHGGSFKDTWIGEMVNWVTSFDLFAKAIKYVQSLLASGGITEALGKIGGFAGKIFSGFGGANAIQNVQNISSISGPSLPGAGPSSNQSNQYSVNAPITVNVPHGTDPKNVGQKVQEGVRDHLDRVFRETNRSVRGAIAY